MFVDVLRDAGFLVAFALSAMALNEIKRSREDGYGVAIAGIFSGYMH